MLSVQDRVLSECCQCGYRAVRVLSVWIECCQGAVSEGRVLSEYCMCR